MPLQKRTDFVYCVSEVKWKNDINFLFCCLVCDNVRDVHFTIIKNMSCASGREPSLLQSSL